MSDNNKERGNTDADDSPETLRYDSPLTEFDGDDEFEEPDRDTDYASNYREEEFEDEVELDTLYYTDDSADDPKTGERAVDEDEDFSATPASMDSLEETVEDDWNEDEEFFREEEHEPQGWPVAMIVVTIVALVLLVAGGYGVIEQRAATQEEIRRLQASLATAVNPEEVAASREALRSAEQEIGELRAEAERLGLENRRLTDTVAGLEAQLDAQRDALAQAPAPVASAAPAVEKKADKTPPPPVAQPEQKPIAAGTRPSAKPAATARSTSPGSGWFVNFASYASRPTAEKWAARLEPGSGSARVIEAESQGRTIYRVRVVDLPDRQTAEGVARDLAAAHGLPELWVGNN
jgi:cell division septation protein DedD